jgi:exopolysaccharide production protein ExoZ
MQQRPAILFYTSNLLLEFLMGVWLCLWMQGRQRGIRVPRLLLVGVALLGFLLLAIPNSDAIRGLADGMVAVIIVWSTVLLSEDVAIPWLTRLGNASYSIYLFHMTIYSASVALFRALGLLEPTALNMTVVIVMQLVLASALGLVIHRFIETPLLCKLRALPMRRVRKPVN